MNLGYPDDYFAQYATRVRAPGRSGAGAGVAQLHPAGEVIWLVVGDLRKVEAGIRELKLGEVVRLDDGRPAGHRHPLAAPHGRAWIGSSSKPDRSSRSSHERIGPATVAVAVTMMYEYTGQA